METHRRHPTTTAASIQTNDQASLLLKPPRVRRSVKKMDQSPTNALIKYGSLVLLVAQMVGLVLLMRYSRVQHTSPNDDDSTPSTQLYLASSAVFLMELMKFIICLCVIFVQETNCSIGGLLKTLKLHVIDSPFEMLKLLVPSFLYTVQNNLLYLALTNLDAATYQVCYQMKILTTALFSIFLLKRKFTLKKWAALIMLTVGVILAQGSESGDAHTAKVDKDVEKKHRLVGLIAVLCAACTSGFSGVYFERILKGAKTSLWLRNIQMGLPSVVIAFFSIYIKDGTQLAQANGNILVGFTPIVWTVVVVQAVGGLVVAVVVKYADSVLKVFAASFSIIISCAISVFLFDFRPTFSFNIGAVLVVTSVAMYASPDKRKRKAGTLPITHRNNGNIKGRAI